MLLQAREAYTRAEQLLEGYDDPLEHAKLQFNFANTLRQIDTKNIDQLMQAKEKLHFSLNIFEAQAPQYLPNVKEALNVVESALKIAPLATEIDQRQEEMAHLQKELKKGRDVSKTLKKIQDIVKDEAGLLNLVGKTQLLFNELSPEIQKSGQYEELQNQINEMSRQAIGGTPADDQDAEILQALQDRLKADLNQGVIDEDRAESISGVIAQLVTNISGNENDMNTIIAKNEKLRKLANARIEIQHYLSHGLPRPPSGTRAAELVELNWVIRRFLTEEMFLPNKGAAESKELIDLSMQATRIDRRIYLAGEDDQKAHNIEVEEFRPLTLEIRGYSARKYTMLAQPIWPVAQSPVETNAVFYSGSERLQVLLSDVCTEKGLKLTQPAQGKSIAISRWMEIQKAMTTVFDMGISDSHKLASVAYELGIALCLGKPIVVISSNEQALPFDVDIKPSILKGDNDDHINLASAVDSSIVWTFDRPSSKDYLNTLNHILTVYTRPYPNTYVDQSIKLLEDHQQDPDPLAIHRTIKKFVDFLNNAHEQSTMLIHPIWPPIYPEANASRLFHIMPFRPVWADKVASVTRVVCEQLEVDYVRGDKVKDPNVIHSIWREIAKASHVLIDLTDFNANVALELGITHTLGKPALIVGQNDTIENLFPMIEKLRVATYSDPKELEVIVQDFLK
jgi:hypothetical protein